MKTVFVIAYEFPPLNVGGVQRPLKFLKYLREFGVNPVVFCLDPTSYPVVFQDYHLDEKTVDDIPADVEIVRVPSDNILQWKKGRLREFFTTYFSVLPKEGVGWRKHIIRAISENIDKYQPDALLVTVPPFSIADLGVELSQRFGLPLLLDMRDAWSGWNMTPYGSYLHYLLTLRKERRCFETAAAVIATSDQTINDFKKLHPCVPDNKFHLIHNGYDKIITDWSLPALPPNKDKFVIGYVGSFYYSPEARRQMFMPWWKKRAHRKLQYVPQKEDWSYRSPYFFFGAVRMLFDRNPDLENKLSLRFAGNKPEWIDDMVNEFGLGGCVDFLGRIPLAESLRFQESCDALLLTSSKVIGGQDYSIAGKTFEYISMKKPIVGFVTEGAQKRLLEKTGLGLICDPDCPEESSRQLEKLVAGDWKPSPNEEFLLSLHRRVLTRKLAEIIKTVS